MLGHTIYHDDKKCVLHQIPSGILNNKICLIRASAVSLILINLLKKLQCFNVNLILKNHILLNI